MADDTRRTDPPDDPLTWEAENGPRAALFAAIAGAFTLIGSIATLLANAGAPRGDAHIVTLVDTLGRAANGRPAPPGQSSAIFAFQGQHWIALIVGTLLVGIGTAAMFPPLSYLWRATRARPGARGTVPKFALITTAIGCVAAAVGLTVSGIALWILAHDFVSAADKTNSVVLDARADPIVLAGAFIGEIGSLALAVSFLLICLHAQRAGLLGRFMGIVGMFAGATIVIRQFDPPGIVRSLWMMALAALIVGRLPNGRPPAWAVPEAVPWPSQQQLREEREAARRKAEGEPERERPARRARGRGDSDANGGPADDRRSHVPVPRAPQARREDTAAAGRPHPSSKKRKRKRRS
jgi:hypothetical protein